MHDSYGIMWASDVMTVYGIANKNALTGSTKKSSGALV